MTPYKQLIDHDPKNGKYGDCSRTSIACMLNMDPSEVPHFFDGPLDSKGTDYAYKREKEWLDKQGIIKITLGYDGGTELSKLLRVISHYNPGVYFTLQGTSPRKVDHVVICRDGEIVHDPAKDGGGLVGPSCAGPWFIEFYSGKLNNESEVPCKVYVKNQQGRFVVYRLLDNKVLLQGAEDYAKFWIKYWNHEEVEIDGK